MIYALVAWLSLGVLSGVVASVRSKESASSLGYLIHAAVNVAFVAWLVVAQI